MSLIIKNYQNYLINGVLTASCFRDVKDQINNTLSSLKKQNIAEDKLFVLLDNTLKELKSLNQSRLSYDQHANIITAKVHLKELQLKMLNVIN